MNVKRAQTIRIMAVGVLLFALSVPMCSANGGEVTGASTEQQGLTPLQHALQSTLEARGRAGQPVPRAVSYEYDLSGPVVATRLNGASQRAMTVTATTTLQFDHPREAGIDRWPAVIIEDTLPANATGFVRAGDYTTLVRDELTKAFPGIWNRYTFGYEPRIYTLKETITIRNPEAAQATARILAGAEPAASHDLVMGVSTTGPGYDYAIEQKWEECFLGICVTLDEFKVGFQLDWEIGLRLPITAALAAPHPLFAGPNQFSLAVTGKDWSAEQYQAVGLKGANGNEFLLGYVFFVGARATVLYVPVLNAAVEGSYDGSKSFATPVGLDASFPIPSVDLPPDATGLQWSFANVLGVGIGLTINPNIDTGGITADWVAWGDAAGGGQLAYNSSGGTTVEFGPFNAGDFSPTMTEANIRLSAMKYLFDHFTVALGGYLQVNFLSYGLKVGNFTLPAFDLTPLTGGLWLPTHAGTASDLQEAYLVFGRAVRLPVLVRR